MTTWAKFTACSSETSTHSCSAKASVAAISAAGVGSTGVTSGSAGRGSTTMADGVLAVGSAASMASAPSAKPTSPAKVTASNSSNDAVGSGFTMGSAKSRMFSGEMKRCSCPLFCSARMWARNASTIRSRSASRAAKRVRSSA